MTGRGIDQILPRPSDPRIHESYVMSASRYVELAEAANGPIPRPVGFSYVWGDALQELERRRPDVRLVNLETSITTSEDYAPKGINYRMHPANIGCIRAAKIDCCVLANNHVLDWGYGGLSETLDALRKADIKTTGAGRALAEAVEPAAIEVAANVRVLVFAFGEPGSGVPKEWAATEARPGVSLLPEVSSRSASLVAAMVHARRRAGDVVVVSVHWGPNWGYAVAQEHQAFARRLIDDQAADIVHGHSTHHPKAIEVYRNRLVLYGCGDFLNDYEGIGGYEQFRAELVLMYFPTVEPVSREVLQLEIQPLLIKRFRLQRADRQGVRWLRDVLTREGRPFGTRLETSGEQALELRWKST
jgi:poly-gamma-glutamate synthesis protein (capsule biosynthesis protein)